jgi:hypothetical protein
MAMDDDEIRAAAMAGGRHLDYRGRRRFSTVEAIRLSGAVQTPERYSCWLSTWQIVGTPPDGFVHTGYMWRTQPG